MRTFEEQYELACKLVHDGYDKMGWHKEQRPMILAIKGDEEKIDVYLIAQGEASHEAYQNMVNGIHKDLASKPEVSSAILLIEAWMKQMDKEELELHKQGMRIMNDPARQEVMMVNIRSKAGQRVGIIKLNRENKRTTPEPLIDPYGKRWQMRGRYVDGKDA